MSKTIYLNFHNNFFDNIIVNKRKEIHKVIYNNLNFKNIKSVLDVGVTEDNKLKRHVINIGGKLTRLIHF